MATNLEIGQYVTVKKTLKFDKTSETFQQGLQSLEPGVVGKVVESVAPAEGRAVVVEFNGIRATITKQRLDTVEPPKQRGRPKGAPKQAEAAEPLPLPKSEQLPTATTKTASPTYGSQVITVIANKLLATGRIEPDQETMVELKLADLPDDVQAQIKALIQAKLALSL